MRSGQGLRLTDRPRQSEVGPSGLPEAADTSADGRVQIAAEQSQQDVPVRWPKSNTSRRSPGLESDRPVSKSRGIGKRQFGAIFRFALAILIGVAGTLSWQAYGDRVHDTVRAWAPSLDWLVPPATTKSPAADSGSAELAEQLKPVALDLAVVRKAIEQLAINQEQLARKNGEMAQSITALQATEQELGDKISSLPAPKTAHVPPRRAPQQQPLSLNAQ